MISKTPSEILFQNNDICILRPDSKKGILVFTASNSPNICKEGLFSYRELRSRHPELGLRNRTSSFKDLDPDHDDLIYFRAPYSADITSFEPSFNGEPADSLLNEYGSKGVAVIRVDPEKTNVYYSEARVLGRKGNIEATKVPMTKYLERVSMVKATGSIWPVYSPFSRLSTEVQKSGYGVPHRMFEVVAKIPHIPVEWLVSCASLSSGGKRQRKKTLKRRSTRRRN